MFSHHDKPDQTSTMLVRGEMGIFFPMRRPGFPHAYAKLKYFQVLYSTHFPSMIDMIIMLKNYTLVPHGLAGGGGSGPTAQAEHI